MKKLLLKSILMLCALVVGTSAWAQSDYSALYTNNVTLTPGSNSSTCTVNSNSGVKCGTSKKTGSVSFTVPSGAKYLHIHVAAWSGETSTTISISPTGNGVPTSISLTDDSGISGSTTDYTLNGTASSSDFYKVITFTNALTSNTSFTISSEKRFVVWGVNSEAPSSAPSSNVTFSDKTPSINYPAVATYSQDPTTATGYSGTITYTMTANTAGATINSSTGVVTVTKGGSVTVKAIAAAVPGSFSGSDDSYTLTVNDTRASAGLTWSAASADVTYGAVNVFPTLTNPNGVTVTYTSSNQAVATIDENTGAITLKDYTGTTTISAIFAGNSSYKDQTVTYELNVSKAPFAIKDGVFDFVEAATADEDYGSGLTQVSTGYTTETKTWTAGNVTMVTSVVSGNGYRWWSADGTLRFYNESKATFSVPSGYVITKIKTTDQSFDKANVGTLSGSTWTGVSNVVALSATASRNIKTITVTYTTATQSETVQSYGWATYIPSYNVEFPANTAYVVTAASVSTGLTLEAVTKVPAGTPLLLKGAGEKTATVIASATAPATNLLSVATSSTPDGKYPYVLAKDGDGACFKQWTGAASALTGRVVLYLDESVATARALFELDDNETTGVNEVKTQKADGQYFNLAGQRVAQPTKGLYIVNGKKVMVK